ncbi:MAG: CZB domain-containing protein [Planctomycetes bacterium]|nr:CZB domain-containing protein [Planctomycetota bacterium]MCC7396154.1 CZB domain-containing protein [Planctomycetota bacterium]
MTATLKDQITAAIGAHGLWKGRLLNAVQSGKCEHDATKVERDDLCEFGKWLQGGIDTASKASPDFTTAKAAHTRFHQEAAKVLRLVASQQVDAAKKCLEHDYSVISTQLVQTLMAWKAKGG